MTTYDNAPPLPGYEQQPGRHCGQICVDRACRVCGQWVVPSNITLGSE